MHLVLHRTQGDQMLRQVKVCDAKPRFQGPWRSSDIHILPLPRAGLATCPRILPAKPPFCSVVSGNCSQEYRQIQPGSISYLQVSKLLPPEFTKYTHSLKRYFSRPSRVYGTREGNDGWLLIYILHLETMVGPHSGSRVSRIRRRLPDSG